MDKSKLITTKNHLIEVTFKHVMELARTFVDGTALKPDGIGLFENVSLYAYLTLDDARIRSHTIMGDFKVLSHYLEEVSASPKEKMDLIFSIIDTNIQCGILESDVKIPLHSARIMFKWPILVVSNAYNTHNGLNAYILGLIAKYQKVYMKHQRDKKLYRDYADNVQLKDSELIIEPHRKLKEHYFDKLGDISEDDIAIIFDALQALGVSDEIINNINFCFRKEAKEKEKAQKRQEAQIAKNQPVITMNPTPRRPIITPNDIKRVLSEYFDFENMEAITYLTLDEVIYCVALLKNLGAERIVIDDFIKKAEEFSRKTCENPIGRYIELRDKLMFYKSKGTLEMIEIIGDIEEALSNMFIISDEDYEFYKSYIEERLKDAENILFYKREYEQIKGSEIQKTITLQELKHKQK